MWGLLAHYFECVPLFPRIPEFLYSIGYFYGFLLGALAGGLLGWRFGFRLPLGAILVCQGFILVGSQIFDFSNWGCPLSGLFGLSAGIFFPVCFQVLTACIRAEQRPQPLFILVFLMPYINVHASGFSLFYLPESPDSISYVLTGAFLVALALIVWSRNPQWLKPAPSRRTGPEGKSTHSGSSTWIRFLQMDPVSKLLIMAGLCVFAVSDIFPVFIFKYYQSIFDGPMIMDACMPLINSMYIGTTMLILAAVNVQLKGPGSGWSLLLGVFLAQVAFVPPSRGFGGFFTLVPNHRSGAGFVRSFGCLLLLSAAARPTRPGSGGFWGGHYASSVPSDPISGVPCFNAGRWPAGRSVEAGVFFLARFGRGSVDR